MVPALTVEERVHERLATLLSKAGMTCRRAAAARQARQPEALEELAVPYRNSLPSALDR
jgi:hypothetical protein